MRAEDHFGSSRSMMLFSNGHKGSSCGMHCTEARLVRIVGVSLDGEGEKVDCRLIVGLMLAEE